MSDRYVLLTGGRNNAGDFLIKHRAKALLRFIRPDRELIDLDGWKPIDDEQLELINGSQALLLTGGPSVESRMYPGIYPLRPDLDQIRVPITTFGVGWGRADGSWSDTRRFGFSASTMALLKRIERDGRRASVRDFHTQNTIRVGGVNRTVMTGCPALFSPDHLGRPMDPPASISRLTISLGTRFTNSTELEMQARELVSHARRVFSHAVVTVAFHHALDDAFAKAYGRAGTLFHAQKRFADWLDGQGVAYLDLSGSAERLLNHYSTQDLHIGYRVHAHIFMTSIRRPSLLLAEDVRGRALRDVLGGHVYDAYERLRVKGRLLRAATTRLNLRRFNYVVPESVATDAIDLLALDGEEGWPRAAMPIDVVERRWPVMRRFLESLP